MNLVSVYDVAADAVLYQLLEQRPARANIGHRVMPTWDAHKRFIETHPYAAWYLIMEHETSPEVVGSVYLTRVDEIGVALFEKYHGRGYARRAIETLMKTHPRDRYFANIAPGNNRSLSLFKKLGFAHIQETYEIHA